MNSGKQAELQDQQAMDNVNSNMVATIELFFLASSKCSRSIELCFKFDGFLNFLKLVVAGAMPMMAGCSTTYSADAIFFFDLLTCM